MSTGHMFTQWIDGMKMSDYNGDRRIGSKADQKHMCTQITPTNKRLQDIGHKDNMFIQSTLKDKNLQNTNHNDNMFPS